MSLILYTIGHGNLTPEDFLSRLQTHQITTLVDVRSAPVSRHAPHFNKDALQSWLADHGITYRFAGAYLGGRPDDPSLYTDGEVYYEKIMRSEAYVMGITRLLNLIAQGETVAIMCGELDPRACHRHHLIARSLLDPSCSVIEGEFPLTIQHIAPDGSLQLPLAEQDFNDA